MGDSTRILKLAEQKLAKNALDSPRLISDTSSILTTGSEDSDEGEVDLELIDLNMTELPVVLISMICDRVSKFSLQGNWLSSLPSAFSSMSRLRYLDMRKNHLALFPKVLTQCPNLEIVDLSENQISKLPDAEDLGNLEFNLRVLSLSSNAFHYLPPCIARMQVLQFLEIDNNPFINPPPVSNSLPPSVFVDKIKEYLIETVSGTRERFNSDSSSDTRTETSFSRKASASDESSPHASDRASPIPSPISPSLPNLHQMPTPDASVSIPSPGDRYRSNSEGHAVSRATKRMGFVVKKSRLPADEELPISPASGSSFATPTTATAENTEFPENFNDFSKHVRGLSHDSTLERRDGYTPANPANPHSERQHLVPPSSAFSGIPTTPSSPFFMPPNVSPGASWRMPETGPARGKSHLTVATNLPSGQNTGLNTTASPIDPTGSKSLQTLPEETQKVNYEIESRLVVISQKIIYSANEICDHISPFTAFCPDNVMMQKLNSLIQAVKAGLPGLATTLEDAKDDDSSLLSAAFTCINAIRRLVEWFKTHLQSFVHLVDVKYVRSMILITYGALHELHNAYYTLKPKDQSTYETKRPSSYAVRNDEYGRAAALAHKDEELYERVLSATSAAQLVLGQLTEAISRSAMETAKQSSSGGGALPPIVTSKMRDLTSSCVSGVDVTRRLKQQMESVVNEKTTVDRRLFWDDLNAFLKSVISILGSTKSSMNYLPLLIDIRPSLTGLAKVAKDIPLLLEYSSYKILMNEHSTSQASKPSNSPSMVHHGSEMIPSSNPTTPGTATTPLVAVLGPAAQAVVDKQGYIMHSPSVSEG